MKQHILIPFMALLIFMASGCVAPQVKLFTEANDPLKEYTLSGEGEEKVLMIPVEGVISDTARDEMLRTKPSMVQEIVSQLELARQDPQIKAVVFKVNSPGGTVTASDIIYHEIADFKKESGAKVVVSMLDIAASGGYYISLPSDYIMAHPTTVTGSVGVIFIRPNVHELLNKIGVSVSMDVSGENKDMGSPFRDSTEKEKMLFKNLTSSLGERFIGLVKEHRGVEGTIQEIATARVYLADEALSAGLIDQIGYVPDAIAKAKALAGIPEDSRVVVYRRTEFPNDNVYNSIQMQSNVKPSALIDLGLPESVTRDLNGFYYLWTPGLGKD